MAGKSIESLGIRFAPKSMKEAIEGVIILSKPIGLLLITSALYLIIFRWGLSTRSIIDALGFVIISFVFIFLLLMAYGSLCAILTKFRLTKTQRDAFLTALPFFIIAAIVLLYHFLVEPMF